MDIQQNSEIGIDDLINIMFVMASKIKSSFGCYISRYQKSGIDIVFNISGIMQKL